MEDKYKIVVTDGYALNPGDLSWELLNKFGEVTVYDRTYTEDLQTRIKDAQIIIVNKTSITDDIIKVNPQLKLICVSATGYDNVDVLSAARAGIPVLNASGYSNNSVAQQVFAFLLNYFNRVDYYNQKVMKGEWSSAPDFTFAHHTIEELNLKTLGILGFGSIGKKVADIALAFGMKIITPKRKSSKPYGEVDFVEMEDFIKNADIISIHMPLTKENRYFFNDEVFSKMKSDAILINTARGPIVDEEALFRALSQNVIRAACLDVMEFEPPNNSKLFALDNCYITPHQAWSSIEARTSLINIIANNIDSWTKGNPNNKVN